MNQSLLLVAVYCTPLLGLWIGFAWHRGKREKRNRQTLMTMQSQGMSEPSSLHPVIDPVLCLGCASCVRACPEGKILGLINGKAKLVEPTRCIGHGACARACPLDSIELVFGTAKRGVDIPHVGSDFQTNIPGIFIAGELGGMGLIRNAIEQGRQAVQSICSLDGLGNQQRYDLVIIGAGPAGFSAGLAAIEKGLNYIILEQDTFGGTVAQFPRGKLVMTAPAVLPLAGKMKFREVSKETLLQFWTEIKSRYRMNIHYRQNVAGINWQDDHFLVSTQNGQFDTRAILLAIGRRGTPRKLGVPGEDLPKVTYRLIDPEQYRNNHVLVVGGGDSALEAAISIAAEPGTSVFLAYRGDGFSRAKSKNRDKIDDAAKRGQLTVWMNSNVTCIEPDSVTLDVTGSSVTIANDAIIVCAGGILPTGFLKSIGIDVETKYGTA